MPAGSQIMLGDVKLPEGSELHEADDILAVHIGRGMSEAQLEAQLAGGAEATDEESSATVEQE